MNRYPIYIISKGRHESRLTVKALEAMDTPYRIVVEPQEYDDYAAVIDSQKILVLPFSNLGQGSIPARNWVWGHSVAEGHDRHWILDDNISRFYRIHKNKKYRFKNSICFLLIEDWSDRYTNVAMAGMQYEMFVPAKQSRPPITFNTRIYPCILIKNDISFRWRGRYNEDTDLSLRVLKSGLCTALFNAFVCEKTQTMTMKGGNTDELYKATTNNRLEFAQSLQQQHPDVVKVVWKYNRWHHQVNYKPFKKNKLIKRQDAHIPNGIDNYGMKLVRLDTP